MDAMLEPGVERALEAVRAYGADVMAYRALGNIRALVVGELLLLNYTDRATYDDTWNDVERACRGLIVHWPTATLAALPFPKFFNLGQRPETQLAALPAGPIEITEKIDGSLGILYRAPDGFAVATRGNFASPQALWATAHLRARHDLRALPEDVTLLFEIVYPANPEGPILRYGDFEGLYLIGARRFDGYDFAFAELAVLADRFGFPLVPRLALPTVADLLPLAATTEGIEGWVIRFDNGLRVKLKTSDYLQLHRLACNVTPWAIRDMLLDGGPAAFEAFALRLPDEFQRQARAIAAEILARVDAEEARLRGIFAGPLGPLAAEVLAQGVPARKPFALAVQESYRADSKCLFALLDGREIRPLLFRALEFAPALAPSRVEE